MFYRIFLVLAVISNVAAQIVLKIGMKKIGAIDSAVNIAKKIVIMATNLYVITGLFLYGLAFLTYSIVLSKLELNRTYPITSIATIVLITIISVLFLQETISLKLIIGLSLCIAGIILIF